MDLLSTQILKALILTQEISNQFLTLKSTIIGNTFPINMFSSWVDYVLIVKDIQSFIWDNVLKNAHLKLFLMGILVLNVLCHKFGMDLTVLVDVLLEKFGLMEIVFAQIITNGMDIIVLLALVGKFGMQPLESVVAHQLLYGTVLIALLVMEVVSLTQYQNHAFALLVQHGMVIHV